MREAARYLWERTTPPDLMSLRDGGGLLLVEDGQCRVDDLVARDDLDRHHLRIQLPCVADEEFEGCSAVQDPLEVVFRIAERRQVHDVFHGGAEEHAGGLAGSFDRRLVRDVDALPEEFLRHDLEELRADTGVTQVVVDEHLDSGGVRRDDVAGVLDGHYLLLSF